MVKVLKPRLGTIDTRRTQSIKAGDRRLTGSALQAIRYREWLKSPTCAKCGRVVAYPKGFELDHIVPLWEGGQDVDANRQILCVYWDELTGEKKGCHADKTAEEAKRRGA